MRLSTVFFAVFALAFITAAYIQISGVCTDYLVMVVRSFGCAFLPPAISVTGFVCCIAGLFLREAENKN